MDYLQDFDTVSTCFFRIIGESQPWQLNFMRKLFKKATTQFSQLFWTLFLFSSVHKHFQWKYFNFSFSVFCKNAFNEYFLFNIYGGLSLVIWSNNHIKREVRYLLIKGDCYSTQHSSTRRIVQVQALAKAKSSHKFDWLNSSNSTSRRISSR